MGRELARLDKLIEATMKQVLLSGNPLHKHISMLQNFQMSLCKSCSISVILFSLNIEVFHTTFTGLK